MTSFRFSIFSSVHHTGLVKGSCRDHLRQAILGLSCTIAIPLNVSHVFFHVVHLNLPSLPRLVPRIAGLGGSLCRLDLGSALVVVLP